MGRPDDWVPLCKRDHINVAWVAAICLNQLTMNFIWLPTSALMNPFCQKLGLNNIAITFIQLIPSIIGLIVPPISAVYSDVTTLKWGRRRIYLVVGEVIVIVGLLMISFCRELGGHKQGPSVAFFVIGNILASAAGNAANGPGRSMCSDLVPPSQQVLVSNIVTLYGGLAGLISNLIGALKLYEHTSMSNETLILMLSCIIGVVALVISVVASPEEPLLEKPETHNPYSLIIQSFKNLTKPILLVDLAFLFFQFGTQMYGWHCLNFFGKTIFGGDPEADDGSEPLKTYDHGVSHGQLLGVIQTIVQVVFSFINTPIVNKMGLRMSWEVGMVCGIIAEIFFLFKITKWVFIIPYMIMGICQVIANSCPYAVVSIISDSDKLAGNITSIVLFGNFGTLISQFAFNMGLGSIGWFKANEGRIIAIPAVFVVLAMICGWLGFSVDTKGADHEEQSSDVNEDTSDDKPASL